MLITRVELENIKSYRQMTIDFRRGTTAISGVNGAGKTTIVEAIGYALFDSIAYNQAQFVREGEKHGRITVHLIGSDDRPYIVERRCGAGSQWSIYDCEAHLRLEQRTDVMDKLHDIFGIDRERSLKSLFQDALGVPQGTFTSIFLQPPSIRKQTFDTLLQIEDYKIAADYLLEAQKQYKEQALVQQGEIQRLTFETRDLEQWRADLQEQRELDRQHTAQLTSWSQQLTQAEARHDALSKQRDELSQLESRYEQCQNTYDSTKQRLEDHRRELMAARAAQQVVEANRANYQRYLQASETLTQLRQDERQRNALQQQRIQQQGNLATIRANLASLQERLEEVAQAQRRIVELAPLVDQQYELEKQRDILTQQATQYESILSEGKQLKQQQAKNLEQQAAIQQRIAEIEPLQPVAALLQERIEALARLRAQVAERTNRQLQLQEKREQLRQKQEERENTAARLRQAEASIAAIEAHRQEAEELPSLELEYAQVSEQRFRLEGNIDGYKRSRKQSAGGLCPFLHEPCLNIRQRGIASLESYFDNLLKEDNERLCQIKEQQQIVSERINFVKQYVADMNKLGQLSEQCQHYAEHLQRLATEIVRLERDIDELVQELEALKRIDQQIAGAEKAKNESQKASDQVQKLEGLHMQLQQLQEQAAQLEVTIQERRQQAKELASSKEQLEQVKEQLEKLNDPRGQSKAQLDKVKQEPVYRQQLQSEQQKQQRVEQQLQALEHQLAPYSELDARINEQEAILQQTQAGYQAYLSNVQAAQTLPQRERAYQEIQRELAQAEQALQAAERAYQAAKVAFHEEELEAVAKERDQLRGGLQRLAETIRNTQAEIKKLERQIEKAEALLLELEAAQKEKATLEELENMMRQFRELIKEAGPYVLKAMLADISAEANRIFGEIMGDRSAQLSWQNDYEIILRRQGVNRTFAQLSGGEQMSAALSVRLALLKKLSTLNIAFFDEPTQNMDELRRMNLAEQIRRVRGFDQLIVISHDDTFEQGLDSIIRLRKVDGETHLVTDEDFMGSERERVQAYAS